MGAIIGAFAEWLGPFLLSAAGWFMASVGPAILSSLTIGVGVFTGISAIEVSLSKVVFGFSSNTADMLSIAQLLGVTFVIKLFVSAFSVRVSLLAAKTFFYNLK
jgi:hypothetical protein